MKMKYSHFLFVLAFLFLFSCKKNNTALRANNELELIVNDCGNAKNSTGSDANGTICFTKLITESRCPTGAVCIWQGYAQCEFSINLNGQKKNFKLATIKNLLLNTDTVINGYKVSLINVLPYPDLKQPSAEPYRAVLKIEQ